MQSLLEFEYSAWLIIVCIIIGIGYSAIQYSKRVPWSKRLNNGLAFIRALVVCFIAMLILGPTARAVKNYFEKPVMVIAIDNSESVRLATDSIKLIEIGNTLKNIDEQMQEKGWLVQYADLASRGLNPDSLEYDFPRTDLTKMIRGAQQAYEGANLGGILVLSDGIFNSGFSPDLVSTYSPIYGLGLGDTIPKKDLSIIDLEYNKTVYQKNRFPINVFVRNEGVGPVTTKLNIYMTGKLMGQVEVNVDPGTRLIEHEFVMESDEAGKKRITIELEPVDGEATILNNRSTIYIDVVEGQQKILVLADAPNPDIKALRLAISSHDQFDVEVSLDGIPPLAEADLIIMVHSPKTANSSSVYDDAKAKKEVPKLYLLGSDVNYNRLFRDKVIRFSGRISQFDNVKGSLNPEFNAFTINGNLADWLSEAPPLVVPFTTIELEPTAKILLYQQVGSVLTERPIAYIEDVDPKMGVIFGDGLWKWRLDEYRRYGETSRFDELISKMVKYLSSKPDNRQFKIYPVKDRFELGEEMRFIVETYNELFEPHYGEPLDLSITGNNRQWQYSFTPMAGSKEFSIDDLGEGLYSFQANTFINGKRHTANGEFTVEKPNLEAADLTADYNVLRRLAEDSGGSFYNSAELDKMKSELTELKVPSVIHSQEREILLFNLPWILVMIMMLATVEWLTRKMLGGY